MIGKHRKITCEINNKEKAKTNMNYMNYTCVIGINTKLYMHIDAYMKSVFETTKILLETLQLVFFSFFYFSFLFFWREIGYKKAIIDTFLILNEMARL